MMKTISLKMSDDVYNKVEKFRKEKKMNRSSYLIQAIVEHNQKLEREALRKKLEKESEMINEQYHQLHEEIEDWDNAIFEIDNSPNDKE